MRMLGGSRLRPGAVLRVSAARAKRAPTGPWPLSINASGRYLQKPDGTPFFVHGDTPWMLPNQLTDAEVDSYIDDRASRGFTAIMFEAPGYYFTSQTPATRNVDNVEPFTTMTDFASALTAYWNRVDRIVNRCKTNGMVCIINPAYLGINTTEGWQTQVSAESDADLQTYGAALANRYTQGNVIWCLGGDIDPDATLRAKQWNIVTGIRTVRTTDLITAHGLPGSPAYTTWNGQTGFNLNNSYPSTGDVGAAGATEYARSGPIPFFMIEGRYEGEPDPAVGLTRIRLQAYQALLSGACGAFFGNNPIWHFESPNTLYPYTGTWETNLNSTGTQQMAYVATLFNAYAWHLLVPKTDTSLVTGGLSTGDTRICPALASNGTFAMIWVPSSQTITVVTNALTGIAGNVRIRRYNVTAGTYTTIEASVAKTSAQSVATGAEGVIVVDAA